MPVRMRKLGDLVQYARIVDFSKPAREKLLAMVNAGESDSAIIDSFVKDYGPRILLKPPAKGFNLVGWLMPFAAIAMGLAFVWWVIRRFRRPLASAAGSRTGLRDLGPLSGTHRQGAGKTRLMMLVAAAVLVIGALIFTLTVRAKDLPEPEPVSPVKHLEERKATIYDNLRDFQFEYRVGKLSDEDYQRDQEGSPEGTCRRPRRDRRG